MNLTPDTPGTGPTLTGRVFVVVDDDPTLLSLTTSALRRSGATAHGADNGRSALTLIESLQASGTPIHGVVCDLRMHGGSGMELFDQLLERMADCRQRLIFTSGDVESDDVRTFLRRADARVLPKPYSLYELRRILAELPPCAAP
jgi:CheY-like chemotaxis protein